MRESDSREGVPPALGTRLPERRRVLSPQVITAYAEASGDRNPIHLDQEYARRAGLPATIAHGMLTLGVACAEVEAWAGEEPWVGRVACRFSTPVVAGETIAISGVVVGSDEAAATVELSVLISPGERALTKARVDLRAAGAPSSP
ncbi:MAG TPA: MaoC/PaaZ C-terminal domain-containing protein [Candidatus Micrarchaeaceae archaeon]|nr:MaoC/PaaZ C-terminal domain-containing protein [Candidatus Micrarchaeaceae archaeon]